MSEYSPPFSSKETVRAPEAPISAEVSRLVIGSVDRGFLDASRKISLTDKIALSDRLMKQHHVDLIPQARALAKRMVSTSPEAREEERAQYLVPEKKRNALLDFYRTHPDDDPTVTKALRLLSEKEGAPITAEFIYDNYRSPAGKNEEELVTRIIEKRENFMDAMVESCRQPDRSIDMKMLRTLLKTMRPLVKSNGLLWATMAEGILRQPAYIPHPQYPSQAVEMKRQWVNRVLDVALPPQSDANQAMLAEFERCSGPMEYQASMKKGEEYYQKYSFVTPYGSHFADSAGREPYEREPETSLKNLESPVFKDWQAGEIARFTALEGTSADEILEANHILELEKKVKDLIAKGKLQGFALFAKGMNGVEDGSMVNSLVSVFVTDYVVKHIDQEDKSQLLKDAFVNAHRKIQELDGKKEVTRLTADLGTTALAVVLTDGKGKSVAANVGGLSLFVRNKTVDTKQLGKLKPKISNDSNKLIGDNGSIEDAIAFYEGEFDRGSQLIFCDAKASEKVRSLKSVDDSSIAKALTEEGGAALVYEAAPKVEAEKAPLGVRIGGETIKGDRAVNEDAIWYDEEKGVAVACDGMGGYGSGDLVAQVVRDSVRESFGSIPNYFTTVEQASAWVNDVVLIANDDLATAKRSPRSLDDFISRDAGTTLCLLYIWKDPKTGERHRITANIGDSRASRIRNGELVDLTLDQNGQSYYLKRDDKGQLETWEDDSERKHGSPDYTKRRLREDVERLQKKLSSVTSPDELTEEEGLLWTDRNLIEHALDGRPGIGGVIEISHALVEPGDRLLVRSDGLTDVMTDAQTVEIMTTHVDPQAAAEANNRKAQEADRGPRSKGYGDDKSTLVIDVEESPPIETEIAIDQKIDNGSPGTDGVVDGESAGGGRDGSAGTGAGVQGTEVSAAIKFDGAAEAMGGVTSIASQLEATFKEQEKQLNLVRDLLQVTGDLPPAVFNAITHDGTSWEVVMQAAGRLQGGEFSSSEAKAVFVHNALQRGSAFSAAELGDLYDQSKAQGMLLDFRSPVERSGTAGIEVSASEAADAPIVVSAEPFDPTRTGEVLQTPESDSRVPLLVGKYRWKQFKDFQPVVSSKGLPPFSATIVPRADGEDSYPYNLRFIRVPIKGKLTPAIAFALDIDTGGNYDGDETTPREGDGSPDKSRSRMGAVLVTEGGEEGKKDGLTPELALRLGALSHDGDLRGWRPGENDIFNPRKEAILPVPKEGEEAPSTLNLALLKKYQVAQEEQIYERLKGKENPNRTRMVRVLKTLLEDPWIDKTEPPKPRHMYEAPEPDAHAMLYGMLDMFSGVPELRNALGDWTFNTNFFTVENTSQLNFASRTAKQGEVAPNRINSRLPLDENSVFVQAAQVLTNTFLDNNHNPAVIAALVKRVGSFTPDNSEEWCGRLVTLAEHMTLVMPSASGSAAAAGEGTGPGEDKEAIVALPQLRQYGDIFQE